MDMAQRIRTKLEEAFSPFHLDVIDESERHAGHAGARPGGQTHFRVVVVTTAFEGLSRLERHRLINKTLQLELAERVHALAIRAHTPAEHQVT